MVGAGLAGKAGVDHDPDAGHGEARLGDRGRQDHPPDAAGGEHLVLDAGRGLAVDLQDPQAAGPVRAAVLRRSAGSVRAVASLRTAGALKVGEHSGDAADLADPGQEAEHVPVVLGERPPYDVGDMGQEGGVDAQAVRRGDRPGGRGPDRGDGVHGAGGADDRRRGFRSVGAGCGFRSGRETGGGPPARGGGGGPPIRGGRGVTGGSRGEQAGPGLGVGGRRGGDQPQVGAEGRADVEQEGEGGVGVQVALVALVEQDRVHTAELGVALKALEEDPGGDDLHDGAGTRPALAPDRESHLGADLRAQQPGHAPGRGPHRHPARLGHDHPAAGRAVEEPGEGERDEGGLAGAGRCDEHGRAACVQGGEQLGQGVPDGQAGPLGAQAPGAPRPVRGPSAVVPSVRGPSAGARSVRCLPAVVLSVRRHDPYSTCRIRPVGTRSTTRRSARSRTARHWGSGRPAPPRTRAPR